MRVRVLDSAKEHLVEGFRFYEDQEEGLGTYFLDSLFSDIDSLVFYGGIHPFPSASIAVSPSDFRSRFII